MKTLILTMTCGEGHNSIAKGLKCKFDEFGECKIFDIFSHSKKTQNFNNKGYLFCIKHIPNIYQFFWNKERNKNPQKRYSKHGSAYLAVKKAIPFVKKEIDEFAPDVIVCTHNYASNILSFIKNEGQISALNATVGFDYCLCPYWESSIGCDYFFIPNECMIQDAKKKGFCDDQIVCSGFPTNPKFEKEFDKQSLRQQFGIGEDEFVCLSMSGGFGQGNNIKLVKALKNNFLKKPNTRLVVICAKNKKQQNKLEKYVKKHNLRNVQVEGFVGNIEEYMAVSDVAFARGSGNNLTECFHAGLVPIIRENMFINEKINKELFIKHDLAFGLEKISDAEKVLQDIMNDPMILQQKKHNIKNFVKPNSVDFVANFLHNKIKEKGL